MNQKQQAQEQGVSFIELAMVLLVIVAVFTGIFFLLEPDQRLQEARAGERWTAVASIANAVAQYRIDNGGEHHASLVDLDQDTFYMIGTANQSKACADVQGGKNRYTSADMLCTAADSSDNYADAEARGAVADACVDLTGFIADLSEETLLARIPVDPGNKLNAFADAGSDLYTQYYLSVTSTDTVIVGACDGESSRRSGEFKVGDIEVVR